MAQKALIPEPETFVGTENVMPASEQFPAVVEPPPVVDSAAIRDLRSGFMMMPVAQQQAAMAEFKARRDSFRHWLVSQMVEGLHFGFSPGTQPKWCDANGKPCSEAEAWGTMGKQNIPLTSWRPKKALYAAGADFVCDLLGIRDELETDHNGWVQAGSNAGTFVVNCKLISRSTGELLANGLGLALTSGEQLGANAALKKAGKRAKVAAVLDYLGLRDLFTGDPNEDNTKPKVENPTQKPDAPRAQPRGKRVTSIEVGSILTAWKAVRHPDDRTPELWTAFVLKHAERKPFNVMDAAEWTEMDYTRVKAALENGL